MRGTGEVPVLYVGLAFITPERHILRAVRRARDSGEIEKGVEAYSIPKPDRLSSRPPHQTAFLFSLPFHHAGEVTVQKVLVYIKKEVRGLTLQEMPDMPLANAQQYTRFIMNRRK